MEYNPPATDLTIEKLEADLKVTLPDSYKTFLHDTDGAEGDAAVGYIVLWSTSEIVKLNKESGIENLLPGFILFGGDGANEGFAFNTQNDFEIVKVPLVGMSLETAMPVAKDFAELMDIEIIKLIIWDFSRTILFPANVNYTGGLNLLAEQNPDTPFHELFYLDRELLNGIFALKETVTSIIFTTGTVQNNVEVMPKLRKIFASIENVKSVGFAKEDQRAYKKLCEKFGVKPSEALFIDDELRNIKAANMAGLHTEHFEQNTDIVGIINSKYTFSNY